MKNYYERAIERWIDNFIRDNEIEPTDEEIEDNEAKALQDYIESDTDSAYEALRESYWE